ncbi:MAG: sulfotransferase family protein [Leptolyngbya sp. SIO3F4]|nr:sulfotransferase family protein [Leptolyngbya sp. SIO3F4]
MEQSPIPYVKYDSILGRYFHHFRPRMLYMEREPLVDFDKKIMLFWSQKSGCTSAIKWLFRGMGILEEALAHNPWMHEYRMWVYYDKFRWYDRFPKAFWDEDYLRIRVVRNPFYRCVSGYVHLLKHRDIYAPHLTEEVTFVEYLEWLGTQDLDWFDGHFSRQNLNILGHQQEGIQEIVHLEDLADELNRINAQYGLNNPYTDDLSESRHHYRQEDADRDGEATHHWPGTRVRAEKPAHVRFWRDPEVVEQVVALYESDFGPFGYATTPEGI